MRVTHVLVVLAAFFALAAPASAASLTTAERSLLGEMNRVRAANGLPGLRVDWRLQRAARTHSATMIRRDFFSHAGFSSRMRASGARGPIFGENLAWGTGSRGTASSIVGQWLASPPHRANLLRRGFVRVGVAAPLGQFLGHHARVATADFAGN
jgi:uncharacterized protein YkwD